MKIYSLLLLFVLGSLGAKGQGIPLFGGVGGSSAQSAEHEKDSVPISVLSWQIDERYGVADSCEVDTIITGFQDNTPVYKYSIANSWTGNLASPLQSKIFFDRTSKRNNIFSNPYDAYFLDVEDVKFFNTRTPYANLTYRTALPRFSEEDYFRALYSMNFNKYLNVGGLVNLILGRGQYPNMTSRALNGGFFSSYSLKHYEFNFVLMFNNFRNYENGGIDSLNKNVESKYQSVKLSNAMSSYYSAIAYYNHKYSLGIERERTLANDSVVLDFVPVTSFIHSIKFENAQKRYLETAENKFYANTYNTPFAKDSTRFTSLKNTFAITLDEKFNTLLKFGLAAFVEHDVIKRVVSTDYVANLSNVENNFYIGGTISKKEGRVLKYNASGQIAVMGDRIGDFKVSGNASTTFKLWNDTIAILASGKIDNHTPDFFLNSFFSNHFKWNNNFKKILDTRVDARLKLQKPDISFGFDFATIRNYIYFDQQALPAQHNKSIQIMSFDMTANIKLWKFSFDNKMVYQLSSDKEILPLPDFSIFSKIYFTTHIAKVLLTQIGVSCRYHTAYYGNSYMPATGQFYIQNATKIGNYPDLNAFVNLHLKRIRIYFQYAHLNMLRFGGDGYMLMPDYLINPATFQVGLSWAFYN